MKVKFYGTRGSIPVCEPDFQEFGGNTTCVQVTLDSGAVVIFDAGSGIRNLGKDLMSYDFPTGREIFIAFSHFHWDHIQGFPFFIPAYLPDFDIILSAIGKERQSLDLESIFARQMQEEYFPVSLENMGANFLFHQLDRETFSGEAAKVTTLKHNHPGGAYTYRVENAGSILVYCTDIEHGDTLDPKVVEISRGADLLIHEAQYTPEELKSKQGWGHSSWNQAVEVARLAGVKRLALTHHDPDHNDSFLREVERECREAFPDALFAREGMEIVL